RDEEAMVEMLGASGDPAALASLGQALRHSNDNVRAKAVLALARLAATRPEVRRQAVSGLISALSDEQAGVAVQAAEALGKLQAAEAVPGIVAFGRRILPDALENQRDSAYVDTVAEALGNIGNPDAKAFLWELFKAGWTEYRWSVPGISAISLARLGERRIGDEIVGLFDEEALVPYLVAMRQLGDKRLNPRLIQQLEELTASRFAAGSERESAEQLAYFAEASLLLGASGDKGAIPVLKKTLELWEQNQLRTEVNYGYGRFRLIWPQLYPAWALVRLGDPAGLQSLHESFGRFKPADYTQEDLFLYYLSGLFLLETGDTSVISPLIEVMEPLHTVRSGSSELLPDLTVDVRLALGAEIEKQAPAQAAAYWLMLANDSNLNVYGPARQKLAQLPQNQLLTLLEARIRTGDEKQVNTYAELLIQQGEPARPVLERLAQSREFWPRAGATIALIELGGPNGRNFGESFLNDYGDYASHQEMDAEWRQASTWRWVKQLLEVYDRRCDPLEGTQTEEETNVPCPACDALDPFD
ncbi:MAG TPA: HEAT repeat domain-containing protein, partial [Candidatus Obscuribacterales bacterium]